MQPSPGTIRQALCFGVLGLGVSGFEAQESPKPVSGEEVPSSE